MSEHFKAQLANDVEEAYLAFADALSSQHSFPRERFHHLHECVVRYFQATRNDPMLHRAVVSNIHGLREFIAVSKRPRGILMEADRLEYLIFGGCDPKEEVADLMDDD